MQEIGAEYPDVETAYQHVDAATIHLVTDPGRFDVIVTDNLFGDIVTDLAAAVCGGIGLAASGNIDATRTNPSMFEPVHGSAPDIAGQGIADPTAAIMSVALLLSHVGQDDAAARVDKAVEQHLATRGRRVAVHHADRRPDRGRPLDVLVHRLDGVEMRIEARRQCGGFLHVLPRTGIGQHRLDMPPGCPIARS